MYIGVCGPSGAGKDTLAELLAKDLGYVHVSGGDVLREMLEAIGLEPKKSAMGPFAEFIREHYGVEPLLQRVLQKAQGAKGLVVSGIRSEAEARLMQKMGGKIIYVDADPAIRFKRITVRGRHSDVASFEEFQALEAREQTGTTPLEENISAVRTLADLVILNEGSLDELKSQAMRVADL